MKNVRINDEARLIILLDILIPNIPDITQSKLLIFRSIVLQSVSFNHDTRQEVPNSEQFEIVEALASL